MKVRRTHTHILVRVMTGQKMAQNQEMLLWGQLMSPPTIKIKDEKYKYLLAKTYAHTGGVLDDMKGEWWMIWRGSGG